MQPVDLFGNPISKSNTKVEKRPMDLSDTSKNTCGGCQHLVRHYYNSNMKYCNQFQQKNTANGFLKIKSKWAACLLFQKDNL